MRVGYREYHDLIVANYVRNEVRKDRAVHTPISTLTHAPECRVIRNAGYNMGDFTSKSLTESGFAGIVPERCIEHLVLCFLGETNVHFDNLESRSLKTSLAARVEGRVSS